MLSLLTNHRLWNSATEARSNSFWCSAKQPKGAAMKITGQTTNVRMYPLWIMGAIDIRTQLLSDTVIVLVNGAPVDNHAAGAALRAWTPDNGLATTLKI